MFNIGAGELAVILIVALIVLGPQRLPELTRTIGKFMREFRRQTDDVRNMVEREFNRMDQEFQQPLAPTPNRAASDDAHVGALPALLPKTIRAANRDPAVTESVSSSSAVADDAQPATGVQQSHPQSASKPEPRIEGDATGSHAARAGNT